MGYIKEQFFKSNIHIVLQFYLIMKKCLQCLFVNYIVMCCQIFINILGCQMENTSECGRVYFCTDLLRSWKFGYINIIEFQRTIQIIIKCRGREFGFFINTNIKHVLHLSHYFRCFGDSNGKCTLWWLSCFQILTYNGVRPFNQEL